MRVSVTYRESEPNFDLDDRIQVALEDLGMEFTGRGWDLENNVRDISFDWPPS